MPGIDPSLGAEPYCYLTTTGRVTGKPHEIEIWFALDGSTAYILSGGRDRSDWVRNLMRSPHATLRVAGTTFAATARMISPSDAEDAVARRLLLAKYATRERNLESWGRTALPVAFDLGPEARP
jgi:deazaflavin-dependent oxidoreductase (nitroreductase family)